MRRTATVALDARVTAMSDEELVAWLAGIEPLSLAPSGPVFYQALLRLAERGIIPSPLPTDTVESTWRRARDACRDHLLRTP